MPRTAACRRSAGVLLAAALLGFVLGARAGEGVAKAARPAVVSAPVADLLERPDALSPVEDQVVLGERVEALAEAPGFTRVRTVYGSEGWVAAASLLREAPPVEMPVEVTSNLAHLYRKPSFDSSRPVVTLPLGARVSAVARLERDGHPWAEVALPDGRRLWAAALDLAPVPSSPPPPRLDPASWIETARRFLGAPYTWGGTTPLGFDCSGLVHRVLRQHGILLKRNSGEICFRDPQLVPVAFERLRPGDLLFFGTDEKVDHVGMWLGDGTVLQATAYGVPSTQVTAFDASRRLAGRFRYARRLAALPGAPAPRGLDAAKAPALREALVRIAAEGGARYAVFVKDLSTGTVVAIDETRVVHAASTFKTAVLLEVLRRVDEGTLSLDEEVEVVNSFPSAVDGSPFSCELNDVEEPETRKVVGKRATVGFLAREMIVRSSNTATNLLLGKVGVPPVRKLMAAIGAPTVEVRRLVEDLKAYEKGLNNETDARGMGALMEACARSPLLSEKARATAFDLLSGQTFDEQVPRGIPSQAGVVVAHKTGSISSVQHDAAILRFPDGRDVVLVLLADGFAAGDEALETVYAATRRMARAVWDAVIAP